MSIDPKRTIEKITRQVKNPLNAAFLEHVESNDHLSDIKERLDKPLTVDIGKLPEEMSQHADAIKNTSGFINAFLKSMTEKGDQGNPGEKGEDGKDGKDGITPEFGKDYFTPEQVEQIKQGIKEEVTPQKGVDYFDGEPGLPGKDADEQKIIQEIMGKIELPENGRDGKSPKIEDIVKATILHLGNLKGNNRPSLKMFRESDDLIGTVSLHKNMMRNMPKSLIEGDQRWGGHGGSSSGGGFTPLQTTSTVDGANTSFVFATATAQPTLIISDGIQYQQQDNNANNQWTWVQATHTVTLITISPPTQSIFGIQ